MAFSRREEPCMPMPIMPNLTRSLAATGEGEAKAGPGSSRIALLARAVPVTAAPIPRNSRRDTSFPGINPPFRPRGLLLEEPDGDLFEKYHVSFAVVLQSDVTVLRTGPALRLESKLLC